MSLRSVSVPMQVKDAQFVGDLINLFERRKIKTGDPSCLASFDSALANDAFRSQLYTLCTAISHMSAEDLSGEQLLTLVARALGGPAVCTGDTVDVPDTMRSAFLDGFDAWNNRSNEPKEPLPWPAPRQPELLDESGPAPANAIAEPSGAKASPFGPRTVQEALDIARERTLAHRAEYPTPPGANAEGLSLAELKALLEEIENRVSRLQPHLHDLTAAPHPPADAFGRRSRMHEMASAPQRSTAGSETQPAAEATPAHRAPPPARINEAAFLARHAYLRPTRRNPLEFHAAGGGEGSAAPPLSALPLVAPVGPLLAVAAAASAPQAVAAALPPLPEYIPPAPAAVAAPEPVVVAPPVAMVAPPPVVIPFARPVSMASPAVVTQPDRPHYVAHGEPASLALGRVRITPHMAVGTLTVVAALIVVVSGLAGIFLYPAFHPKTISDFPNLKATAASTQGAPTSDATGAQIVLTAGDPSLAASSPQAPHYAPAAASKVHAKVPPPPPTVAVWPFTNQVTVHDAVAPAPATTAATHRALPSTPPLYVPSTTIIGYALSAPQPGYPRDQPRGISGTVVVQIAISREGYVTDIRVVSGPIEMRPATVQAVQAWRFRPYLVNGAPADVTTTLGFLFKGQ